MIDQEHFFKHSVFHVFLKAVVKNESTSMLVAS